MKDYRIGKIDWKVESFPMTDLVLVSVGFKDESEAEAKDQWLTLAEVEGFPSFYLSDINLYTRENEIREADSEGEDEEDEDVTDQVSEMYQKYYVSEFGGVQLGEYESIFDSMAENPGADGVRLVRLAIALTRADAEDMDKLIKAVEGKCLSEIDIPVSDVEADYILDNEE